MKTIATPPFSRFPWTVTLIALLVVNLADRARAANKTWDGGGADDLWQTGANWDANTAPAPGDSLVFTLTTRLNNTNNFPSLTSFDGIAFNQPAAVFTLWGNSITLSGNITDNQPLVTETINLPLTLSAAPTVNVGNNASLTIGGMISGGFGFTKTGNGVLKLSGANTFSGSIVNNAGTVSVSSDGNLGTPPGAATPGSMVLNGGALRTTSSFALNANRGIALGPPGGAGAGTFDVDGNTTLSYGGVIANNGGTGGLTKLSFGGLTLSGANTFTGPTLLQDGTLTLDFTQGTSPANNVIASSSSLTLGGAPQGLNQTNFASLVVNGKAGATSSQTFNGTTIEIGPAFIQASSGAGGTANLNLGALAPSSSGLSLLRGITVFTPPSANGGAGNITTTTANTNGILGGWAFMGPGTARPAAVGFPIATNWASVDGSGNIVNFTDFFNWPSGNLAGQVTAASNVLISSASAVAMRVAAENAGATVDVNTIKILNPINGTTITIGTNNTLRLGRFGGLFVEDNASPVNYVGGSQDSPQTGNGTAGSQNIGRLTAGGAPNTPGVVVITRNASSETAGSFIIEAEITDNGSAPVTVVKAGVGSIKIDGRNTYSGGLYILQGRVQFAANEIATGTGNNHAGGGTGPIYILPGAYLFPNGPSTNDIPNEIFIGGLGMAQEPGIGAIRMGNGYRFLNTLHLISDARIGSGTTANTFGGILAGRITGDYALDLGAAATINGNLGLSNPNNDWSGRTTLNARNTGGGANVIYNLASEVIPHGLGKGNVVMNGNTGGNLVQWNLNGFNETINGLSTINNGINCIILNGAGPPSTLTVGDNDQSGIFDGALQDAGGTVALTKIKGGAQTLGGVNTYTGTTTVDGGTLAVSGSIASSQDIRVNSGATLDVSGVASEFTVANILRLNNATLVANSASVSTPSLSATNSRFTLVPDTGRINLTANTLTTGGATNRINIATVAGVSGYPSLFPLIKYTGSIGGAGPNFGIGEVPSANTVGFISNETANARLVLVLNDGPKPLTWTGTNAANPTVWDNATTTNWLAFKGQANQVAAAFNAGDSIFFDDTAGTNNVGLVGTLSPGGMSVNNSTLNYTFFGSGGLSGFGGILKEGTGTLTLANSGLTDFRGGVAVNRGTVIFASANAIAGGATIASGATAQLGTNSGTGNLPVGNITIEGSLVLNRGSAEYTVANKLLGFGSIAKNDPAITTFSGVNNTYTGAVLVAAGTLRVGTSTALGTADGFTSISNGATLDINGQTLTTEPVIVAGAGVTNGGALVNLGAANQDAMGNVTLANHATFGGTGRWDIRGGAATLSTGGNAYNLTKVGAGQFSLVGVTVDPALANIVVSNGIFSVEASTDTLGNSASTLTVHTNGTLQFFNTTVPWNKVFVLNGHGIGITVNNGSGDNTVAGAMTLNGPCVFNAGGTTLTLNGALGGSGSLLKIGTAPLILDGVNPYSGNTIVNGGTLVLNGINTAVGSTLSNAVGTTLSGRGTNSGPVRVNGAFQPGGANVAGPFTTGDLTMTNAQITFDIGTNDFNAAFPANDLIIVNGALTLNGTNTITFVAGPVGVVTNGQVITLIRYSGARTGSTNNLRLVSPPGYALSIINPDTTPNVIQAVVNAAPSILAWRGLQPGNPTAWDVNTTPNWTNYSTKVASSTFTNFDSVIFDDLGGTNLVTLVTNLQPTSITMNNNAKAYTFAGSGRLIGSSGLTLQGSGTLIVANSGSNAFTGPININAGTLQVGDGSTSGNLGPGPLTNNAGLVFNRSGNLTVNNGIAGSGSLTNNGTGVVTVGGANTHDGTVMIAQGTLRAGSGTALGSVAGATVVANGATLDTGGQTLNNEQVSVSGAGVGGLGAIVNNVGDAANGLGDVTLEGHTTFGGTRRWDIRGGAAQLSTSANPYNLTKVGSNEVWLVSVSVDAALSNVTVQAGLLGYQDSTSLGNPAATLTIAAGGGFGFFNSTVPLDKVIVLNGSGTNNTLDARSGAANTITTPVALSGGCIFNSTPAATVLTLNGGLAGTASLTKTGDGLLSLLGINAYTGNTTITGGTLALNGPASPPAFPTVITIGPGATLDVTALAAGPTLTLSAGQRLQGGGSVNGSVISPTGTTVAPGSSVGLLTVTNDVTLQGTTIIELSPLSNSNDRLRTVSGSITYGGTLIVTNLDGVFFGNEIFKLFESGTGNYLSSFASIQLPPLPPGYGWITGQLTVDGTLRLKGPPAITSIFASGGNVIVSGTDGTNNGSYYVLSSTNVAVPLSNWTRLQTNTFDANGNFSFTNAITIPQRFYLIQQP